MQLKVFKRLGPQTAPRGLVRWLKQAKCPRFSVRSQGSSAYSTSSGRAQLGLTAGGLSSSVAGLRLLLFFVGAI